MGIPTVGHMQHAQPSTPNPSSVPARVLVVAAHPDDETLGAGGTIAKHALHGDVVSILIIGRGVSARTGTTEEDRARLWEQAKGATTILGASLTTQCQIGWFPDNEFDAVSRLTIVRRVEDCIQRFKPTTVYTHHEGDRNIDHRMTHDAVLTACRPLPDSSVRRILAFEVPSSTEWGTPFVPTVFVDIHGEPLRRKMKALEQYAGEMLPFPHPRSVQAILSLSAWRGANVGLMEAEAFELIREIC